MSAAPTAELVEQKNVLSLSEAASEAWTRKAELDSNAAAQSLASQLFRKIKIKRETYEIDTQMFNEADPRKALGVEIDGLFFGLKNGQELAVLMWECEEAGCEERILQSFSDLASLGFVLARGEEMQERFPKCERHMKGRGK